MNVLYVLIRRHVEIIIRRENRVIEIIVQIIKIVIYKKAIFFLNTHFTVYI